MRMHKYYFVFDEGSRINQLICAVLINLPVFAYGACLGWMSPMTLLLQSDNSPRGLPLSDVEISWMAAAPYLVSIPTYYIIAYMADKIGRKTTVLFTSASCATLWTIKLSSLESWALLTSRALVGVSMAGSYVACPVYTKEISDDNIRGFLGTLVILFHTTDNLLLFIIGDICSYQTVLWICLSFPLVHICLFVMMPESPSYLIKTGKQEEAVKALAWLRCRNDDDKCVQQELAVILKQQNDDEKNNNFIFKEILTDKILLRAFGIAMMTCLARELCGTPIVFNFAAVIFSIGSEGRFITPNQQAMLLGAVQLAGSLLASSIVEKAGRRPLLIGTSFLSGISLWALASWFLAYQSKLYLPEWLPVLILCICIFSDAAGLLPVSIVITGEIFSFKYRGAVMASTMAVASLADFLQLLFFKPITGSIGIHIVFYFCGTICLLNLVYVAIYVPETKQRSLEEIYEDLKTEKEKENENCHKDVEVCDTG